jgi:phosphatidylinositol alpha-1,6-mannosyltransferase
VARTLVVTNDFPPRIGGIEGFVAQVCRLLDDDVVVLTSRSPGDVAHDASLPYAVVRAGPVLLPTPAVRDRAVGLLGEHGADRVVFGAAAPLGLLAPALRAAGARHLVALSHGHEVWWARLPVSRTLLRRIGDGVDHVGVISAFTRGRLAPALSPVARAALVSLPPPVDLDVFRPEAGVVRPGRCVAAARLVRQKGLDTLLRAWAGLATPEHRELVVVGAGPDRRRLERLAARLDVEVRFTGAVPHRDVPALLASAQVVALPVRTRLAGLHPEGLGLGFVEAAACGRPVLVGRSGGAPETVVDAGSGYVIDPDDVATWTRRLAELLADPDRADAMGAAGRAYVAPRFGTTGVGRRLRLALDLPLT